MAESQSGEEHTHSQKWTMLEGLPQQYWQQLIEYTISDPDIAKYTSDLQRFATQEQIEKWVQGERAIYTITDLTKQTLLGVVWFSPKILPAHEFELLEHIEASKYPVTQGRRVYGSLRGTGNSTEVFVEAIQKYLQDPKNLNAQGGFWTETSNPKIISANTKLGYREASKPNQQGKVLLLGEREAIRASVANYKQTLPS